MLDVLSLHFLYFITVPHFTLLFGNQVKIQQRMWISNFLLKPRAKSTVLSLDYLLNLSHRFKHTQILSRTLWYSAMLVCTCLSAILTDPIIPKSTTQNVNRVVKYWCIPFNLHFIFLLDSLQHLKQEKGLVSIKTIC